MSYSFYVQALLDDMYVEKVLLTVLSFIHAFNCLMESDATVSHTTNVPPTHVSVSRDSNLAFMTW
jgi:hypothetical protein